MSDIPPLSKTLVFDRRRLLLAGAGTLLAGIVPATASADQDGKLEAAIREMFGDAPITEGRVTLNIPPIAENGHLVNTSVEVESPMTEADHVCRIGIFSPRNPISTIAEFHLGPRSGKALVATRVRLAGTQTVMAVAEMSDGTLWSGSRETIVTLAACIIM